MALLYTALALAFTHQLPSAISRGACSAQPSLSPSYRRCWTGTGDGVGVRSRAPSMLQEREVLPEVRPTEGAASVAATTTSERESRQAAAYMRLARIRLLNNIALVNAVIIGAIAFSAGYEILGTDLKAIAALYYFDLGDDLYPGFARAAVSADLLARLPMDLIHNYEALVPTNPIYYKACTSGVAYALGDFISQVFQGRDLKTMDLARSARSGAAGFIGHGPLCHFWMLWMVSGPAGARPPWCLRACPVSSRWVDVSHRSLPATLRALAPPRQRGCDPSQ